MNQKEKILWAVVAVLCVSQVAVLWSVFRSPVQRSVSLGRSAADAPVAGEASATPAVLPGSKLAIVKGRVQSVSGKTLTLSTSEDGSVARAQVTSATKIVKTDGSQKGPEVQQSELAAYNAQAAELGKDQERNKSALETLMVPLPFVEKPVQLSDIKAGDSVTVFSFDRNGDGSYDARQIVVLVSTEAFRQ